MNLDHVLRILSGLAVLKYFPANNEAVLLALAKLCGEMCDNETQISWLVGRMTSGLYEEWPGPREMRACFCAKFKPKDGINMHSSVYLDGIPSERASQKQLPGPEMKVIGPSEVCDPKQATMNNLVIELLVSTKSVTGANFSAPATPEEIAAAPKWLRELEGYK